MNTAETSSVEEPFDLAQGGEVQVLPGDIRLGEEIDESELEEGSPQALYAKASFLRQQRRYSEASRVLQELVNNPSEEIEDCCKAMVYADLAQLSYWTGQYEQAVGFARQTLSIRDSQSDLDAYAVLTRVAIARFDFDTAQQYHNHLVKDPVMYSLVSCFMSLQKGNIRSAERSLVAVQKEGVSDDPEYKTYLAYLGMLRGEAKSVKPLARSLVEDGGLNPMLLMMAAEVLIEAGDYSAVHSVLKELEPGCAENDRYLVLQARFAAKKELYGQAMAFAKKALEMNPENEHAQAVVMRCELEEGNAQALEKVPDTGEQRERILVLVLERVA